MHMLSKAVSLYMQACYPTVPAVVFAVGWRCERPEAQAGQPVQQHAVSGVIEDAVSDVRRRG